MAADNAKTNGVTYKTVDEILAMADTPEDTIFIEAWDTNVRIRGLTKQQQVDIRMRAMRDGEVDANEVQRYMWLEAVLEPKFSEEHLGPLFQKQAGAIDKVLNRVLELSGMTAEAIKKKEQTFPAGARKPV